jgi:hypothetical protein
MTVKIMKLWTNKTRILDILKKKTTLSKPFSLLNLRFIVSVEKNSSNDK